MTDKTFGAFVDGYKPVYAAPDMAYESDADIGRVMQMMRARVPAMLVSGRAGTGKSRLIGYIKGLKEGATTLCVAPTGIAALSLGAPTIHSAFQLPMGVIDAKRLEESRKPPALMKKIDRLIIDEISMVRADCLDAIDRRLRIWRDKDVPFGGVQVMMVGDFLQLPPVVREEDKDVLAALGYETPFAFSAHVLRNMTVSAVTLSKVWRQDDESLIAALGDIRKGRNTVDAIAWLNACCMRPHRHRDPLVLTATRASADQYNEQGLHRAIAASETPGRLYTGTLEGAFEDTGYLPAPVQLTLVPGLRVMAVRNDPRGLFVNGSLGMVTKCEDDRIEVRFDGKDESVVLERETWSRMRQVWDAVKSSVVDEEIGRYTQFPLVLGYAITIHKSQGLTLEDVRLDLGRGAFAPGQLYVALSRVRSIEGLSFARALTVQDAQVDPMMVHFLNWAAQSTSFTN